MPFDTNRSKAIKVLLLMVMQLLRCELEIIVWKGQTKYVFDIFLFDKGYSKFLKTINVKIHWSQKIVAPFLTKQILLK